jgi:hypothetical protein
LQYYIDNKEEIGIPPWNPRPIPEPPAPPSPKKSGAVSPLKAGAGADRAAMSLKNKREERDAKEGEFVFQTGNRIFKLEKSLH